MAIKLGENSISRIYLGTNELTRIYLGASLVYESNIYLSLDCSMLGAPYMNSGIDNSLDYTMFGLPIIRGF